METKMNVFGPSLSFCSARTAEWLSVALISLTLALLTLPQDAAAQQSRGWVSGTGNDANNCSRSAPCATFQGALAKTVAGGEINALDPGSYGAVSIDQSITINGGGPGGLITAPGANAITINGAGIIVTIRGIDLQGRGEGLAGIRFVQGAVLNVEDCNIRNFGQGTASGILFAPSAGKPKLNINNCSITDNGVGAAGAGIQIAPTGTAGANVVIRNTNLSGNPVGVRADSAGTTGIIDVNVSNTSATASTYHGFVALSGTGLVRMMLDGVVASNNGAEGVRSVGANSTIRITGSQVTGNVTGLAVAGGGRIQSFLDNKIFGNTVDGAATTSIVKK